MARIKLLMSCCKPIIVRIHEDFSLVHLLLKNLAIRSPCISCIANTDEVCIQCIRNLDSAYSAPLLESIKMLTDLTQKKVSSMMRDALEKEKRLWKRLCLSNVSLCNIHYFLGNPFGLDQLCHIQSCLCIRFFLAILLQKWLHNGISQDISEHEEVMSWIFFLEFCFVLGFSYQPYLGMLSHWIFIKSHDYSPTAHKSQTFQSIPQHPNRELWLKDTTVVPIDRLQILNDKMKRNTHTYI